MDQWNVIIKVEYIFDYSYNEFIIFIPLKNKLFSKMLQ